MSKFTRIRRTINALSGCYSFQKLDKELITRCLNDVNFQSKYVEY